MEFECNFEKSTQLMHFISELKKETIIKDFDIIYNNEEILINNLPY